MPGVRESEFAAERLMVVFYSTEKHLSILVVGVRMLNGWFSAWTLVWSFSP